MARRLRIEYPGALYHILSRGNRREPIFLNEPDYLSFISTLDEACAKTDWKIHAYCLMPNHFHLALETPRPNLVAGMKWLLGTYTVRFNSRHHLTGHLFAGRYTSIPVSPKDGYLETLADFIHLNPVRANLLQAMEPLRHFAWSSFSHYLRSPSDRPSWLRTDRLLNSTAAGRAELERRLEEARGAFETGAVRKMRKQWYLGDEEFRKELLRMVDEKAGNRPRESERIQYEEELARVLLGRELKKFSLAPSELDALPKGHPHKVEIAKVLRAGTTMTMAWVARELRMGTPTYLNHLLYWDARQAPTAQSGKSGLSERVNKGDPGSITSSPRRRVEPVQKPELPEPTRLRFGNEPIGLTDPLDPRFD